MEVLMRNNSYKGRVQAVILDWSGTAVDYGCIGPVAVFTEVFRNVGVEVTIAEARAPMGLMKKDHIRALCGMETIAERWQRIHGRLPNKGDVEALYCEVEPLMTSMAAQYADPIRGLLETVALLREQGVKVGSSTGYTRSMMELLIPAEEVSAMDPKDLRDRLDRIEKRFRDFGAHFVIESIGESPAIIEQINSRLAQGERP